MDGQAVKQALSPSNTGSAPLQINSQSITDAQFPITGPSVPRTILPGDNLSYTLEFSPEVSGKAAATLTIASDASTGSITVSLAGVGEKAFADLVISPAVISFGNLPLKPSKPRT